MAKTIDPTKKISYPEPSEDELRKFRSMAINRDQWLNKCQKPSLTQSNLIQTQNHDFPIDRKSLNHRPHTKDPAKKNIKAKFNRVLTAQSFS